VEPPSAGAKRSRPGSRSRQEELPYTVELWQMDDVIERVLARAANALLARAIFKAAQDEHPGRRITLRRGSHIVADSSVEALPPRR